jgi:transglutaminase-like putative cysteine protease
MERRIASWLVMLIVFAGGTAIAADMPGPSEAEWALEAGPETNNAAAVVLERSGSMFIDDSYRSSYLEIYTRLKILTEEGVDYGSISIFSSNFYRAKNTEGRTNLPGGKVVELAADATFERSYSDKYDTTVVSCALPEVVPGAIVEYRYRVYFDSVYYPVPWYFQDRIPTRSSHISYDIPKGMVFKPIPIRTLASHEIKEDVGGTARGTRATYSMTNAPPVPDEPAQFPFVDLSSRVRLLPLKDRTHGRNLTWFETWDWVVDHARGNRDWGYTAYQRNDGASRAKGRQLAGDGTKREQAERIFNWVRDEIDRADSVGIWTAEETADDIVHDQKGDSADQALLLRTMLDAAKIKSSLGWINPRTEGRVIQELPDPSQFDRVIVVLELDGEEIFLDPYDKSLAFGRLQPAMQGVPCLLVDHKKPEWTTTPQLPADQSTETATIALAVDEDGALSGTGRLELTGNHGWRRIMWKDTADEARDGWSDWIQDQYPGFDVDDIEVAEDVNASRVVVTWSLQQREDEVLGDESSITPSAPLAVDANPFTIDPRNRLTPVQLSFPDTDHVELTVTWPEGWQPEAAPRERSLSNDVGSFHASVTIDSDARSAHFTRDMVISQTELDSRGYAKLRDLYLRAVDADGSEMLLVRE